MLGFRSNPSEQGKTRRFRFLTGAAGAIMAIVFAVGGATGCGAVQDAQDTARKVEDGASKAQDIVNAIPTSPADVRDKVTAQLQTTELTLDSPSCSLSNSVAIRVETIGKDWPTGPYMTIASYSATKTGDFQPVPEGLYTAAKPEAEAHPSKTWSWPCVTPVGKDKVGWYKVYIVHFDANGAPDQATKTAMFEVVA